MKRKDKIWLAVSGFLGGVGFTIIAFNLNHKSILNESLYLWSGVFVVCLVYCLTAVFREAER